MEDTSKVSDQTKSSTTFTTVSRLERLKKSPPYERTAVILPVGPSSGTVISGRTKFTGCLVLQRDSAALRGSRRRFPR